MTDICTTENSKGDYMNFTNKKLLILGGTHQHCKMVRAAKELGVYVIVTDYLEESPAKKIGGSVIDVQYQRCRCNRRFL